jgi:hypothetical protein
VFEHHYMKTCRSVEVQLHAFLISSLNVGKLTALCSRFVFPELLVRRLDCFQSESGHGDKEKNY